MKSSSKGNFKDCIDEAMYISSKYKTISVYPKVKAKKYTRSLIEGIIIISIVSLLLIAYYFQSKTSDIRISCEISLFFLLFAIYNLYLVKKRIKTQCDNNINSKLIIDEQGVTVINKNLGQRVSLEWDAIKLILINKYSICVLPKNSALLFLFSSIDEKKYVLKELKKNDKLALLVDNTDLYI